MTMYEKVKETSDFLKSKIDYVPQAVIVLGSGLGTFAENVDIDFAIDYKDIVNFPISTVKGHKGRLIFGTVSGKKVAIMQGRFHFYEGWDKDEIALPVRVFAQMGIEKYIVTNAAGAINLNYKPSDFMIIEDHIGLFCPSVLWGENDENFGVRFPSMSSAYDKELIDIASKAAQECNLNVHKGIYCYCKGPMFETPAEIRLLRTLGADAVGMSTVPEVICAVHSGMRVLGISCMTNMAAGILDTPLTQEEVDETGRKVKKVFSNYMKTIISKI